MPSAIPKSSSLVTSVAPLEVLRTEIKDLTKIQPLALRGEITTWQYDAKNCIRLHYRMIDGHIMSRRLDEAIRRWAKTLLIYASAFGFTEEYPASLCRGRPSILQGYWYLTQKLQHIGMSKWISYEIEGFRVERKVDASVLSTYGKGLQLCALHHNSLLEYDYAVRYRCRINRSEYTSELVGGTSLRKLIAKITKATKKHYTSAYREVLLEKMRSKTYDTGKLRPGFRKA